MVNVANGYGSSILGYPRIGSHRELKHALEQYWRGIRSRAGLLQVAHDIRHDTIDQLDASGITQVPGNWFSLYDHVLDNALLFGAVPTRFEPLQAEQHPLDFYFTMARGYPDVPPLELVKFFGTNYHYRQPEVDETTEFSLHAQDLLDEFDQASARGIELRPIVLGPVSLLLLSKVGRTGTTPESGVIDQGGFDKLSLLDALLPVYEQLFEILAKREVTCVQLDEPSFT